MFNRTKRYYSRRIQTRFSLGDCSKASETTALLLLYDCTGAVEGMGYMLFLILIV